MGKTRKVRKVKGGGKSRPLTSKSKLNSKLFKKPLPVKKENVFSMSNLLGALENTGRITTQKPKILSKKSTLPAMKEEVGVTNPIDQLEKIAEILKNKKSFNQEKAKKLAGAFAEKLVEHEVELRNFLDESNLEDVILSRGEAEGDPKDFLNAVGLMFESLADTYDAAVDDQDNIAKLSYTLLIDFFEAAYPEPPMYIAKNIQSANAFKMKSLMNALNSL